MHPASTISLQKRMGKNHDAKVIMWKKDLETNIVSLKLMKEIREHQLPCFEADDMVIERSVDVSESSVNNQTCPRFFHTGALRQITDALSALEHNSRM